MGSLKKRPQETGTSSILWVFLRLAKLLNMKFLWFLGPASLAALGMVEAAVMHGAARDGIMTAPPGVEFDELMTAPPGVEFDDFMTAPPGVEFDDDSDGNGSPPPPPPPPKMAIGGVPHELEFDNEILPLDNEILPLDNEILPLDNEILPVDMLPL